MPKHVMSHTESSLVYKEASVLEETNPKEGFKAFRRLEARNKPRIFLPAVICPIIAFFIEHGVSEIVDGQLWVYVVIFIGVGFVPPLLIEERRLQKLEAQHSSQPSGYAVVIGRAIFRAAGVFFSKLIVLLVLVIMAGIVAALTLFLVNVFLPVFVSCMVFFFLTGITAAFYEVPPDQFLYFLPQMVKRIPVALRSVEVQMEILPLIAGLAIAYLLYGAGFGLPYKYAGLAGSSFAGIMLGLYLADRLKTDHIFANLLQIAKARCLVRLGREDEALYILRAITEDHWYPPKFSRTPVVKHLAQALRYFILDLDRYRRRKDLPSNRPIFEDVASNRMTDGLSSCWVFSGNGPLVDYPYEEIYKAAKALQTARNEYIEEYIDSIDKTRRLVGLGDNQPIERLIHGPLKSL